MTLPETGIELVVLGQRYVITPEHVGLTRELLEVLAGRDPDEQRNAIEAVLYGAVVTTCLEFRSLDNERTRLTVTAEVDGRTKVEIGDLT